MDFVYDKLQAGGAQTPVDNAAAAEEKHSSIDVAADKLETGIENVYAKLSVAAGSSSWGSIWATVKKQGEAALEETKRDLSAVRQEIGSLLETSPAAASTPPSTEEAAESSMSSSQETVKKAGEDAESSKPAATAKTMLSELTKRAQLYIDDLDRDLEKIENAAGSYLGKVGKDVKSLLKDAVTVSPPTPGEAEQGEVLFDVPESVRNQIYSTRLDAQLHALHTSTQPFLTTTSEPDYEKFASGFNIEEHTSTIAADLDKYKPLRALMESLVPEKVPYNEFWTKYYYMRQQIQEQEQKRKALLERATAETEAEVTWDESGDEEEDATNSSVADIADKKSTRSSTDDSYDHVSKASSIVDLSRTTASAEDDEDDWE